MKVIDVFHIKVVMKREYFKAADKSIDTNRLEHSVQCQALR